jgi:hypothetical protein
MSIFPISPTIGDRYSGYEWDGTSWNVIGIDFNQEYATTTDLSDHELDTSNVHGITDTSLLATKSYADNAASTAASTTVTNLIDSAPNALNTLNELAAALGDDPNFATTIATSLGNKADIDSPTFTGIPLAPTAIANTNTNQIATTAFVKSETDSIQSQLSNIEAIAMLGL